MTLHAMRIEFNWRGKMYSWWLIFAAETRDTRAIRERAIDILPIFDIQLAYAMDAQAHNPRPHSEENKLIFFKFRFDAVRMTTWLVRNVSLYVFHATACGSNRLFPTFRFHPSIDMEIIDKRFETILFLWRSRSIWCVFCSYSGMRIAHNR